MTALRQHRAELVVDTPGRALIEVTARLAGAIADSGIADGLATVFCRHTSASLLIQENADPDVLADLEAFFARLVRDDPGLYRHTAEGPDDMPAHIRAALTQSQLSIPVAEGRLVLGTWQGVYLYEHRARAHRRTLCVHVLGA